MRCMEGRAADVWGGRDTRPQGWGSKVKMKKMTFGDAIKSSFILNINYRHSFKKIIFCFISRLGGEERTMQGRREGKIWGGEIPQHFNKRSLDLTANP